MVIIMKTAIYDKSGRKIAGDTTLSDVLSSCVLTANFPLIEAGKLYTMLSDGNISVLCADEKILESFLEKKESKRLTKSEFLKNLLFGIESTDIKGLCTRYDFSFDEARRIFVAEVGEDVSAYIPSLEEIFDEDDIIIIGLDSHRVAFICIEGDTDAEEMAGAISATFQELNADCFIGVSCIQYSAVSLSKAFEQSLCAISVGKKLSYSGGVWFYSDILPELIISQLPKEALADLKEKAYEIKRNLDDETIEIALEFFKNNLNISETAKRCYLHRNTLIYKLDKIQKDTGFNLRNFNEAVALKIYIAANKVLKK